MKRFLLSMCAVVVALVLAPAAQAQQQGLKKPGLQKQLTTNGTSDVDVDGRRVGTFQLTANGTLNVTTLKTGHRVSLLMKNGVPTGAQVVDSRGGTLPATVHTESARRVIVIVIRSGGTVIVIIISQRVA